MIISVHCVSSFFLFKYFSEIHKFNPQLVVKHVIYLKTLPKCVYIELNT